MFTDIGRTTISRLGGSTEKITLAAAVLATTAFGSLAHAASFNVQYTAAGSGPSGTFPASIFSGTLTLSDTANSNGYFAVTSLSGTRNGDMATLIPVGGFPLNQSPNDNLFRPTSSYVTDLGISYTAAGQFYNLHSVGSRLLECSSSTTADCSFGGSNSVSNFSVNAEPIAAAVPEPATWAMMLFGSGGMGAAMRSRKKVTTRVQFA